jgi:ribonuclease-3
MSRSDEDLARWARERLGHHFADIGLVRRALTHGSAGAGKATYQRLEFLGDRVLGCSIAAWLYARHDEPEGQLTSRLHALVKGSANAEVARSLGVPDMIAMEPKAKVKGLQHGDNVLGDIAEALVAAVFLDGGWAAADALVRREWAKLLTSGPQFLDDPKSRLQQWALQQRRGIPVYALIDRQGPAHAPTFTIEVSLHGIDACRGTGTSKQEAEKAAAVAMLALVPASPATRKQP